MAHSAGMFEMWRNASVQQYSGPAQDEHGAVISLPASTSGDSDRLISFWLKAASDGWGFRWAMHLCDADQFVGHIGFNSLLECSEIAYHMNPRFWGQGLMSEAAVAAIAWRRAGGASQIEAFIEPNNTPSIALALRLGMTATSEYSEGARRYLMSV